MENKLIQKFIKESGLSEFKQEDFIIGINLRDEHNGTMLIVQPPFTENIIDVIYEDVTTRYHYKKCLNNEWCWVIER